MFNFTAFQQSLSRAVARAIAKHSRNFSYIAPTSEEAEAATARSIGGYNRHRAVTAAASKRAAAKRRNLRKRSPH